MVGQNEIYMKKIGHIMTNWTFGSLSRFVGQSIVCKATVLEKNSMDGGGIMVDGIGVTEKYLKIAERYMLEYF